MVSQFPLGHLRYAMIHKITIVPIIGTNESSDNHGDRPVRRKIRHDGTIVTVISTTQKSTEITSNTPTPKFNLGHWGLKQASTQMAAETFHEHLHS